VTAPIDRNTTSPIKKRALLHGGGKSQTPVDQHRDTIKALLENGNLPLIGASPIQLCQLSRGKTLKNSKTRRLTRAPVPRRT
jgi:hypothetical protein